MGFGGGSPSTPAAAPPTPVPQPDDPKSLESQQNAALIARRRDGASAHLLSGEQGDTTDPNTDRKQLSGGNGPAGSGSLGSPSATSGLLS